MKHDILKKQIGKKKILIGIEHKLPEYLKKFPMYDSALPRICTILSDIDNYLKVIDIGANIGDTVSLITDVVGGSFLCIEGDEEYLDLLIKNTTNITGSDVVVVDIYCSDSINENVGIIKKNGTARLSHDVKKILSNSKFDSLDNIVKKNEQFNNANLIKVDTDGFEINVLNSASNFINEAKPLIFFEFDPVFYKKNGHESLDVFKLLIKNGYTRALIYDNFGFPIEMVYLDDVNRISELMAYIDMNKIYYYDILACHDNKYKIYKKIFDLELLEAVKLKFTSTTEQLTSTTQQLTSTTQQLTSTTQQLTSTTQQLTSTTQQLTSTTEQLDTKNIQLNNLRNSREYKIGLKIQRVFKAFFPTNSLRRKLLVKCINCVKKSIRLFKKSKTFFYVFLKSNCYKLKSKKKRNINKNAKKIVYVGHSYHNKTKSTIFLQEYLAKFFDIEIISDESWNGEKYPDLSFINKKDYIGVVFFQILPPDDILKKIDNENILFCPMYDQSGRLDFNYWDQYRNLKIINFSKTLHQKLKKWGLESIYVQYFPEVKEFVSGKKNEVFFWQRLEKISIKTLTNLLKNQNIKIHLHKAIDPNQKFIQPTKKEEKKYNITYSEWFDTREEMQEIIKQKAIYIAPREYEGIGQSFIEAMAIGKAVVAVNNPTMNEYIKHGETGYLFDLDNLQKIDLSNVAQIQKNAYNYMKKGRKQWLDSRKKIIDFVKKDKW